MFSPATVKLHSHHSGTHQIIKAASLWRFSLSRYPQRPHIVLCSANNEHDAKIAMSKSDLESCQWLQPSSSSPSSSSSLDAAATSFSDHQNVDFWSSSPSPPSPGLPSTPTTSIAPSYGNCLPASVASFDSDTWPQKAENGIEKAIFDFRFLSMFAVAGSLAGSFICFLKGGVFIMDSYVAFYTMCSKGVHTGLMVLRLVEAVDVYLTGTVMLIFGMGLYGLFISNVPNNLPPSEDRALRNSSLFGMFLLQRRPKWMSIASLDELKTKLGHVVVMILLVKMFERSKAITIATSFDLLSYSFSIFLTSAALLVLRNLSHH